MTFGWVRSISFFQRSLGGIALAVLCTMHTRRWSSTWVRKNRETSQATTPLEERKWTKPSKTHWLGISRLHTQNRQTWTFTLQGPASASCAAQVTLVGKPTPISLAKEGPLTTANLEWYFPGSSSTKISYGVRRLSCSMPESSSAGIQVAGMELPKKSYRTLSYISEGQPSLLIFQPSCSYFVRTATR